MSEPTIPRFSGTSKELESVLHGAVVDNHREFFVDAVTDSGMHISVPMSYQIEEKLFRPYRAGKAEPAEINAVFKAAVESGEQSGQTSGIEGEESVKVILTRHGLGPDCSNLASHGQRSIHSRLGLPHYFDTVFRDTAELKKLRAEKASWQPEISAEDENTLMTAERVTINWIARVFGKDHKFVTGSEHMSANEASMLVLPQESLPGDMLAFRKAGEGVVTHVALVEEIAVAPGYTAVSFSHAWNTRDTDAFVRHDEVRIEHDGQASWSHEGLGNPARYESHEFRRPLEVAALALSLS